MISITLGIESYCVVLFLIIWSPFYPRGKFYPEDKTKREETRLLFYVTYHKNNTPSSLTYDNKS